MQAKNIFGRILHGCSEVSVLIVRSSSEPLTPQEQMLMKSHFLFCKCCKNFANQSLVIDESLHTYFKNLQQTPKMSLSDSFKREMEARIEENTKK